MQRRRLRPRTLVCPPCNSGTKPRARRRSKHPWPGSLYAALLAFLWAAARAQEQSLDVLGDIQMESVGVEPPNIRSTCYMGLYETVVDSGSRRRLLSLVEDLRPTRAC